MGAGDGGVPDAVRASGGVKLGRVMMVPMELAAEWHSRGRGASWSAEIEEFRPFLRLLNLDAMAVSEVKNQFLPHEGAGVLALDQDKERLTSSS